MERGVEWPMILVGTIAAILLAAGLLPPYFELWQRKGRVVGISTTPFYVSVPRRMLRKLTLPSLDFGFLTIDVLGAFFSLMALGKSSSFSRSKHSISSHLPTIH